MPLLFALEALQFLFGTLLFGTAVFLILLVLVQRGRGGGLSGALGGAGGQSAFGAKAGDAFTKITMVVAGFWILLCASTIVALNQSKSGRFQSGDNANFKLMGSDDSTSTGTNSTNSGVGSTGLESLGTDKPGTDKPGTSDKIFCIIIKIMNQSSCLHFHIHLV